MEPAGAVDYSTLREQFAEQKQREQNQEEGDLIHVTLKLPGDATKQLNVKAGHQVEYLKAWLKEQPDVGERGVRLLHEGREMIDPLSFMDYPDIAGAGACTVTVELL